MTPPKGKLSPNHEVLVSCASFWIFCLENPSISGGKKKALFLFGEEHSRCLCNPGGEDVSPNGGSTSQESFVPNISEYSVYVGVRTTE